MTELKLEKVDNSQIRKSKHLIGKWIKRTDIFNNLVGLIFLVVAAVIGVVYFPLSVALLVTVVLLGAIGAGIVLYTGINLYRNKKEAKPPDIRKETAVQPVISKNLPAATPTESAATNSTGLPPDIRMESAATNSTGLPPAIPTDVEEIKDSKNLPAATPTDSAATNSTGLPPDIRMESAATNSTGLSPAIPTDVEVIKDSKNLPAAPSTDISATQSVNSTGPDKKETSFERKENEFYVLLKDIDEKLSKRQSVDRQQFTKLKELGENLNLLKEISIDKKKMTYLEFALTMVLEDKASGEKEALIHCVLEIFQKNWKFYEKDVILLQVTYKIFKKYELLFRNNCLPNVKKIGLSLKSYLDKLDFFMLLRIVKGKNLESFKLIEEESFNLMDWCGIYKNTTYLEFVLHYYSKNETNAGNLLCCLFLFKDENENQLIFAERIGLDKLKRKDLPTLPKYHNCRPIYNLNKLEEAQEIIKSCQIKYKIKYKFIKNTLVVLTDYIAFMENSFEEIFNTVLTSSRKFIEHQDKFKKIFSEKKIDLTSTFDGKQKSYLLAILESHQRNSPLVEFILLNILNEKDRVAIMSGDLILIRKLKETEKIFHNFLEKKDPTVDWKSPDDSLQLIIEKHEQIKNIIMKINFENFLSFFNTYDDRNNDKNRKALFEEGKNKNVLKKIQSKIVPGKVSYLEIALNASIFGGKYNFGLGILDILRDDCMHNEKEGVELLKICSLMQKYITLLDSNKENKNKHLKSLLRESLMIEKFRAMVCELLLLSKKEKSYNIKKKALVEFLSESELPLLSQACKYKKEEPSDSFLLALVINPDRLNKQKFPREVIIAKVKALIEAGASVTNRDGNNRNPLELLMGWNVKKECLTSIPWNPHPALLKLEPDLVGELVQLLIKPREQVSYHSISLMLDLCKVDIGNWRRKKNLQMKWQLNIALYRELLERNFPLINNNSLHYLSLEIKEALKKKEVLPQNLKSLQLKLENLRNFKPKIIPIIKKEESKSVSIPAAALAEFPSPELKCFYSKFYGESENEKKLWEKEGPLKMLIDAFQNENCEILNELIVRLQNAKCLDINKINEVIKGKQEKEEVTFWEFIVNSGDGWEELISNSNLFVYSEETREEKIERKTFEQQVEGKKYIQPVYNLEQLIYFRDILEKKIIPSSSLQPLKDKMDRYILFIKTSFLEYVLELDDDSFYLPKYNNLLIAMKDIFFREDSEKYLLTALGKYEQGHKWLINKLINELLSRREKELPVYDVSVLEKVFSQIQKFFDQSDDKDVVAIKLKIREEIEMRLHSLGPDTENKQNKNKKEESLSPSSSSQAFFGVGENETLKPKELGPPKITDTLKDPPR